MSAIARRAAFQAVRTPFRPAQRRTYAEAKKVDLKEGARRDPELYVRLARTPIGT